MGNQVDVDSDISAPTRSSRLATLRATRRHLTTAWQVALGPDWRRIQQEWLHTLGNLTLTGYNSEYSDRTFDEKRDMKGGFTESPLRLNAGLGQQTAWDEAAIKQRADRLADIAVRVWASPKLPDDVRVAYRPTTQPAPAGHTIADHPHLLKPPMDVVFQTVRTEILALDPVVTEEFLKLYVAYKAETNFVDIVPQAKRVLLTLNMAYSDIVDPRGLCKDVTGLGRWGNGDVEVAIASVDDVPYVMGLVRQSLQQQLGDDHNGA